MRKILLLFILINLHARNIYAQKESSRDSLLRLLKVAKQDTNKVKLLLAISGEVEDNEPVASELYYRSAALLSKQLAYQEGEYNSLNGLAKSYYIRGLYDTSFIFFTDALRLAEKMKDIVKMGSSKLNIGSIYREKGEFEKALAYCIEGRRIIENTNNNELKAKLDDALQVLYFERAEYDKAIEYGESALKVARKSTDKMLLVKCAVNLSLNYMSKKRYSDAELLLRESLVIAKAKNNKRVESAVLVNLGGIALKRKDAPKLKKYATRSLQLSSEIGSLDGEALALRAMGMGHLLEGNIDSAKYYAGKAFTMDTLHHFRKEIIEILNLLANISFASGNVKEGFDYDERVSDTLELMVNEIISQQSADLEKKYETEKKDSQLKIQQAEIHQKNIYNYLLIGGTVAILLILLLTFRTFQQKQKLQQTRINELEAQQQLTATEAVLKGEEQERTRLAKDLHDGLGGMLSGIKYSFNTMKGNLIMTPENAQAFERSMDMLDSSIREMRRVAHNMMPEALVKFGLDTALKDFCNDINQSGALQVAYQSFGLENIALDQTTAITIYRIVQELINNTMKHAAAKTAIIQLTKSNGHLSVTVEDDGKGFDTDMLNQSKGTGWSNIQNRVEFLKGTIDVKSTSEKGTSVYIEMSI